jgi:hypothetical protein
LPSEKPQRHIVPIDEPVVAELPLGTQIEVEVRLQRAEEQRCFLDGAGLSLGEEALRVSFAAPPE